METMARINISTPIFFKCKADCSQCCEVSDGAVFIDEDNIKQISKFLKISRDEFLHRFTKKIHGRLVLADYSGKDCIFLDEHKCLIYPVRPVQCRTFPFWPQNLKSQRRWNDTMDECPGIGEGEPYDREEIEKIFEGAAVDSVKQWL